MERRPRFRDLVDHSFIKFIESVEVDVGGWYSDILDKEEALNG